MNGDLSSVSKSAREVAERVVFFKPFPKRKAQDLCSTSPND